MQEILFTELGAYSFTPLLCENRWYRFMKYGVYFYVAKKEKRLYLLDLQKLIVLHFDVNNQEEN